MSAQLLPRRRTLLAIALMAALHAPAFAAEPVDAEDAARDRVAKQLDTVSVIGQGNARQVHRISVQETALQPPGASPLQVLAAKPGVHFVAADPFGNYEWSTRFSLRGFNQARLGFTLDGIPLGDMSYGNNNGMHISRAIIAENLAGAELAEGIGALGTASSSDLGGTVQFFSADPRPDFGATLAQSVGSDAARRIPSDQRFQAALDSANGAREPDDKATEIAAGLPVRFSETTHRASLIFDRKAAPGFDAFVRERLEALFAEYQLSQEG